MLFTSCHDCGPYLISPYAQMQAPSREHISLAMPAALLQPTLPARALVCWIPS
jgi:hypothetical protein